jgi:murein DD-endopeptidase MepM/ murein hydrolase activator NlpD
LEQGKNKRSFWQQLKNKYRLVIMNDKTYQELASFRLSRLNIFIALSTLSVSLIIITVMIIIATPIKEYIPGYGDVSSRNEIIQLRLKSDSLVQLAEATDKYLQNINNIINGNISETKPEQAVKSDNNNYDNINLESNSPDDAALRNTEEKKEKFLIKNKSGNSNLGEVKSGTKISEFYFFAPIKGTITSLFNPSASHFGVDVVAAKNEPIKAVLDGVVVISDWTLENGYTIAIQHANGIVTNYKHSSVLYKKVGNFVKAGDVIALVGNTGELSKGTHLHFELWYNGIAVNPKDFINFK